MKRMMNALGCALAALALFAAGTFAGCSSDGGSSDPVNAIDVPKYSTGKIIKNKVVSVGGGDSGYYEYLEFESGTGGKYHLYKDGAEITAYPDESGTAVPAEFSYNPESGEFSAEAGGRSLSSYMFNAGKDGKKVPVIAAEEMKCNAEKPALLAEWEAGDCSFVFNEDSVEVKPVSFGAFSAEYTVSGGWITVLPKVSSSSGLPLFYSSSGRMFYLAYETERSETESVGKSAAATDGALELVSPLFILAGIQL